MAKPRVSVKQQIDELLAGMTAGKNAFISNPDWKDKRGRVLYEIFVWQTICSAAEKSLKAAWKAAQTGPEAFIDEDDELRQLGSGDHIVVDTDCFSVTAKLASERSYFNPEHFADDAVRKWKVKKDDVLRMIEAAKLPGNPSLTKRVLEAAGGK